MDRKIKKSRKPLVVKSSLAASALLLLGLLSYQGLNDASISTFRVQPERLTISTVSRGVFEDFIPVRGSVTPYTSVFLDAIEGGRVEKVFVEGGTIVEAGQPLLELSNATLQLDVISREAQVGEQLNNLRNTRLSMEDSRLTLKTQLVDIDYQIVRLERQAERLKNLSERDLVSEAEYVDTLDELQYQRNRRDVIIERQEQDERLRQSQIASLEDSVGQLERNLEIARSNLESLTVKALISGQLTSLDAEIGQSKAKGETLGQIDNLEHYKIEVLIDEFYVTRTQVGQYGEFSLSGNTYELRIGKVYPEITNGQFKVDMAFTGKEPQNIRRGQTVQIRVQLGDANGALLLPRGGFFQDTGGNWAFVLTPEGDTALRRDIRLGRRNPEYFEILEGLEEGDQVITSSYTAYEDIERIRLSQ